MLNIDTANEIKLEASDLVGKRVAVLGVSGQGKTNTAAVLIEESLSNGVPLTIVDIEGEYWSLKEQYQLLVVGAGPHVDMPASVEQAAALATFSVNEKISIVLDLSEFSEQESREFLLAYFEALWTAGGNKRQPYQIVLEEAHEWIPEGAGSQLKSLISRIALRGRKRGLGIILMSQRAANVSKNVLGQAEILFLHWVGIEADTKTYKSLIPLPAKQVEEMINSLQIGEAIFVYRRQAIKVRLRVRHTTHLGATPQLEEQVAANLREIDQALLDRLAALVATTNEAKPAGQTDKEYQLARRNKELEAEVAELRRQVADLEQQVRASKGNRKYSLEQMLSEVTPETLHDEVKTSPVARRPRPAPTPSKPAIRPTKTKPAPPAVEVETIRLKELRQPNQYDRARLDPILNEVGRLPREQKIVLALLLEHDGKYIGMTGLIEATGIAKLNLKRDYARLIALPFGDYKNGVGIRSKFDSWVEKFLPGVDRAAVLKEIRKRLA